MSPRATIFGSGATSCETLISSKPTSRAMRATSCSWCRMAIGVQQADGERFDAGVAERLQLLPDRGFGRCDEHLPVVRDALVDFDDGRGQRRRLANRQVEQPRPVLIADVQHVAEAARGDQRRAGAACE